MLPEGFGEVAERLRRSTVRVLSANRASGGSGSGIIWDANGTVITNAHVARDEQVRVELWDGRSLPAAVTARDAYADLARLRLRTSNLSERVNRELKRRTRVVGIFPNAASLERLATAVLMEIDEDWQSGMRYLTFP